MLPGSHPISSQLESWKIIKNPGISRLFLCHSCAAKIKSFDVIPGNRYRWTLETKVVNNGPAWKRTHVLTVVCGKGDESQQLVKENIAEPKNGTWTSSSLNFTVPQNKSEVTLQLFRFAEGTEVSIDNYKLDKL